MATEETATGLAAAQGWPRKVPGHGGLGWALWAGLPGWAGSPAGSVPCRLGSQVHRPYGVTSSFPRPCFPDTAAAALGLSGFHMCGERLGERVPNPATLTGTDSDLGPGDQRQIHWEVTETQGLGRPSHALLMVPAAPV